MNDEKIREHGRPDDTTKVYVVSPDGNLVSFEPHYPLPPGFRHATADDVRAAHKRADELGKDERDAQGFAAAAGAVKSLPAPHVAMEREADELERQAAELRERAAVLRSSMPAVLHSSAPPAPPQHDETPAHDAPAHDSPAHDAPAHEEPKSS